MQYSLSGLALAALCLQGTIAAPSAHRRHEHKKRQMVYSNPNWEADVDWATVNYGGPQGAATSVAAAVNTEPTATSAPAVSVGAAAGSYAAPSASATSSASSSAGSSSSGSGGGQRASSGQQCQSISQSSSTGPGFGGVTAPIDDGNPSDYIGNVGCPYASNIQLVDSADGYSYTITMQSTASSDRNMIIWLKAGPTSPTVHNTGQYEAPAMSFTLGAGQTQVVAFDENTQPVFCDWTEGQKNADGSYQCAYAEADFGNTSNGGWGGFDVSNIQNGSGSCGITLTGAGQTSSCSENNYSADNAAVGGIGGNVAPGPWNLDAQISD